MPDVTVNQVGRLVPGPPLTDEKGPQQMKTVKSPVQRTMRVATTLTGVAACAAGFAPAAAHATTDSAHTAQRQEPEFVNLGKRGHARAHINAFITQARVAETVDGPVPPSRFSMGALFTGVSKIQFCGWHPTNDWRCTITYTGFDKADSYYFYNIGGNKGSWNRGKVDVYWNGGGAGKWDTCNTNGDYNGFFSSGINGYVSVVLSTVGPGYPTC
jgi:hypothetical protein